jgi:branched-chain amino acid transport system substrate-binding protein
MAERGQDLLDGAQMAVIDMNARGGVIGKKVVLRSLDDGCQESTARDAAKQLHETDPVAGALGGICDDAAKAAAAVLGPKNVPFLVTSANRQDVVDREGTPSAYLMDGTPYQSALAAVRWLAVNRIQQLAVVSDGTPEAEKEIEQIATISDPTPQLVSKQAVKDGGPDLASIAKTLMASKPDGVYWSGPAETGGKLLVALRAAGYTGMFTASKQAESPDFVSAAGKDAEGAFVVAPASPQNLPEAAEWTERFTKRFNHAPGRDAMLAYDALRALGQAVTQTGLVDAERNSEQLFRLDETFLTFLGNLSFAFDHTIKYDNNVVLKVKDGAFALENKMRSDS